MDMDISMDIHVKSVDMDAKFHFNGKPALMAVTTLKQTSCVACARRKCSNRDVVISKILCPKPVTNKSWYGLMTMNEYEYVNMHQYKYTNN